MTRRTWMTAGLVLATVGGLAAQEGASMSSLVAAERAFAALSVATSQREAFLAYFDDEGVWFTPGPTNTRGALLTRPATTGAPQQVLDWAPVMGDISEAGDLGYSTGPWSLRAPGSGETPGTLLGTGWFFTVWQRRPGQPWKVLADIGIDTKHDGLIRSAPFVRSNVRAEAIGAAQPAPSADDLRAADRDLARAVSDKGWQAALAALATDDVRVYRQGQAPGVGRPQATARLAAGGSSPFSLETTFARVAASGDIGLSDGAYRAGPASRGHYLHVWKRVGGRWRLAADVSKEDDAAKR